MQHIYFVSGPCGVGKTTTANALAKQLVAERRTVCLIHGDDLGDHLLLPDDVSPFTEDGRIRDTVLWNRLLRFNWQCLLDMTRNALDAGADVVIYYVIEQELPLVSSLAREKGASLHYAVLTATKEALTQRIHRRGDPEILGRSLFLKTQLEQAEENRRHLLDISGLTPEQTVPLLQSGRFLVNTP